MFYCLLQFVFIFLQAKQRATIKWLLSKAYNNRIPENVLEPFYKDYDVSYLIVICISRSLLL